MVAKKSVLDTFFQVSKLHIRIICAHNCQLIVMFKVEILINVQYLIILDVQSDLSHKTHWSKESLLSINSSKIIEILEFRTQITEIHGFLI